ncbi:MAG: leader peptide processing enzyme [Treponema sp.]|nr:leader peptide processing enzyme [Treponema sp.]
MDKRLNTILFILGATLFNVIVAVISFIILALFYGNFIISLIPESGQAWGFSLVFLASIAISILVYRIVLRYFLTKIDVEKYFDPLFVRRNVKKP